MYLNLDVQENKNINSSFDENPDKKYINSINNINNNLINKETNNTTDEKKKKQKSKKSLFDKYNITTKLIKNFFRYFLINDLNYKIKKSIKNYRLFKNIYLQKLNKKNSKYLFNLTIENVFKSYNILKRYTRKIKEHNLSVVESILKSNKTELKNILSLKVKNYFKNYYMNKEEKKNEYMNNNKKNENNFPKNFEGFLNKQYQKQKDYFDKKTLNEYIQKIREVALEIINDDENEDNKHEIQIEENKFNFDRPEENNYFENSFDSIHNLDESLFFFNDNFDEISFFDTMYDNKF